MKILQVTYVRGVAGCEKFLLTAIPSLIERGHDVQLLILYVDEQETLGFRELLDHAGIRWHAIRVSGVGKVRALSAIANLMKQFDLVNTHLLHADLLVSLAKRLFARKTILVSGKHGYEEWYTNRFGFDPKHRVKNRYWRVLKFAEKNINASFVISDGLKKLFIGLGLCKESQIELIHYGFRFDEEALTDQRYRFGDPQLCIVGRLTAYKGHRFAFEAVDKLRTAFPGIRLVLVGKGELEEELRSLAEKLSITEHVIFCGFQSDARNYMATSDIVLLPSVSEGFGIVLAEAMSVKRPIVAFNVPSPSELLKNNSSGLLVEPFDTDAYAQAIHSLLKDPGKAAKIALSAEALLYEKYNLENMTLKLERFYQQNLNSAKRTL